MHTSQALTPVLTRILLTGLTCACSAASSSGQSFLDKFIDPTDGYFDVSGWLAQSGAFLPMPVIITEPAVGVGGGVAGLWFHDKPKGGDPWAEVPANLERKPPTVSFAVAAATSNGTWLAGGGHVASWKEDTIRYAGALMKIDANLDFYVGDDSFAFNFDSEVIYQDIRLRLGESDFFLGGDYLYFHSDTRFDDANANPDDPVPQQDERNAGLGVLAYYDTRNNSMATSRGTEAEFKLTNYAEVFGSDNTYNRVDLKGTQYLPFGDHDKFVYGSRLEFSAVGDGSPFYGRPFIKLRGIPVMRFQGDQAVSFENQLGYQLHPRWSVVGFLGLGGARYDHEDFPDSGLVVAGGGGFRYMMARALGMNGGIDVAVGPDGPVVYLTIGSGL